MKLFIASDHAGYELKEILIKHLNTTYDVVDMGTNSTTSIDYPDVIHPLASEINNSLHFDLGIIICGTGNGVSMTANKYPNIRCALCWNKDISEMARLHNNANIIALPARYITTEEAYLIVDTFLDTDFEGGRHSTRINKINIK